ncbi:hypothetical protein Tco_0860625 [Tanacetum coccineum]|uniref:Uncharacterized protein n=1 Tax=Tanacetum coccineum TaxID=301880 RepID=A0ABQ5BGB3_9ASTR
MPTCSLAQYVAHKTNVAQQFTPQKHYRFPHPGQGLHLYASSTTSLVGYTDADWAGCPSTRRSTSVAKLEYRGRCKRVGGKDLHGFVYFFRRATLLLVDMNSCLSADIA